MKSPCLWRHALEKSRHDNKHIRRSKVLKKPKEEGENSEFHVAHSQANSKTTGMRKKEGMN